jgi:hypothetical protein
MMLADYLLRARAIAGERAPEFPSNLFWPFIVLWIVGGLIVIYGASSKKEEVSPHTQ